MLCCDSSSKNTIQADISDSSSDTSSTQEESTQKESIQDAKANEFTTINVLNASSSVLYIERYSIAFLGIGIFLPAWPQCEVCSYGDENCGVCDLSPAALEIQPQQMLTLTWDRTYREFDPSNSCLIPDNESVDGTPQLGIQLQVFSDVELESPHFVSQESFVQGGALVGNVVPTFDGNLVYKGWPVGTKLKSAYLKSSFSLSEITTLVLSNQASIFF
jgi:hypothetical protein